MKKPTLLPTKAWVILGALVSCLASSAQEARIEVRADQPGHRLSPYLTGACIEDVNHEIYGGLYSQMVFGESFQEPAPAIPPRGFQAFGGRWSVNAAGELWTGGGDGPKLVSEYPGFAQGMVGVEVLLPDRAAGNAGLIVKVNRPGTGADNFDGYEISLDAAGQILRLGRHRHNWEHIRDTPCEVPVGQWIPLTVKLADRTLEVSVKDQTVIHYEDSEHPLPAGRVGLRPWQREARFRNLWVRTDDQIRKIPFEPEPAETVEVSGMWRVLRRGTAVGRAALVTDRPFVGAQSQSLVFANGEGEFGLENQGLNRWGMYFVQGKPYKGRLWARTEKRAEIFVALESADGAQLYAEERLTLSTTSGSDWQPLDFTLTPSATDKKGRLAIKLKQPGSVVIGYALLQPDEWGRFKGLPVRRDVAEALVDQGLTVLRYGGSMINHPEYRWKKMIGPRDRRPPYRGTWYPHSSNGWGIPDFLSFCEAAGFLAIPAFNMGETPQDMADFIEYANGPADSPWGRHRAADGHPEPYRLRHLQLGNEERVDERYFRRFQALAEAIWAKDKDIILVVGDFVYRQAITDPMRLQGAVSGITNMLGHQRVLELARAHQREVWFDIHIWTGDPFNLPELRVVSTYVRALDQLARGARHRVAIFEFNANNHDHRRALANAWCLAELQPWSEQLPVICSANCLQPDGQNDNGWNQGLLFLNPAQVWLQPPGYVTRMISRNHQPRQVPVNVTGTDKLQASAKQSEDGSRLVLQIVNLSDQTAPATIRLAGFTPSQPTAVIEELAGPLDAANSAANPRRIKPKSESWRHDFADGSIRRTLSPYSFTILRLE